MTQRIFKIIWCTALLACLAGSWKFVSAAQDPPGQDLPALSFGWTDIGKNIHTTSGVPNLVDMVFIGAEGWVAAGNLPEIYHTSNGGQSWEVQTIGAGYVVNGIAMRSLLEGYAIAQAGPAGRLFYTTDGGAHWTNLGSTGNVPRAIDCPPAGDSCFLVGDSGKFIKITGTTQVPFWTGPGGSSNVATNLDLIDFPINSSAGYWGGGAIIRRFENDAVIADQTYPSDNFNGLSMSDLQHGWAVGDYGVIVNTVDGKNWSSQVNPDPRLPNPRSLNDVFALDSNQVWAVGNFGALLHTSDGGVQWQIEANGLTNNLLWSVFVVDPQTVYAGGSEKTLLKYGAINLDFRTYLPVTLR